MSDHMSAVMGATTTVRTMADGTFRIQVDVEPRYAQSAFALFGAPGTPIALARITNEAAVEHDRAAQTEPEKKGGPLARLAAQLGADPEFQRFIEVSNADEAAERIRGLCRIESRAQLDNDPDASAEFHRVIRGPWLKYRASRGLK